MKRMIALLMVSLFTVAVIAIMAVPAFADKPNASGKVGNGDKKVGALSQNPNDRNGAYTPGGG